MYHFGTCFSKGECMIRKAEIQDIPVLNQLLEQVLLVHHQKREDIFKPNGKKYSNVQLKEILTNEKTPVFVYENEQNQVCGYAFCIFQQHIDHAILSDIKTLYIDDLCVDENYQHQHIGQQLYEYVIAFAKENHCYNVTLNVWACNEGAIRFYEKCGLKPQKIGLEKILGE